MEEEVLKYWKKGHRCLWIVSHLFIFCSKTRAIFIFFLSEQFQKLLGSILNLRKAWNERETKFLKKEKKQEKKERERERDGNGCNGLTEGQTDTTSHRDAWPHLKMWKRSKTSSNSSEQACETRFCLIVLKCVCVYLYSCTAVWASAGIHIFAYVYIYIYIN